MLQISDYYGKCLMKVESNASTFATQFNRLPVTGPSAPPAVDRYGGRRDYGLINAPTTSQRILPPPEPDCRLSAASKWSPPFAVCQDQLTPCRNFTAPRASGVDGCSEAVVPVELRSHAAVKENYSRIADYKGQ